MSSWVSQGAVMGQNYLQGFESKAHCRPDSKKTWPELPPVVPCSLGGPQTQSGCDTPPPSPALEGKANPSGQRT